MECACVMEAFSPFYPVFGDVTTLKAVTRIRYLIFECTEGHKFASAASILPQVEQALRIFSHMVVPVGRPGHIAFQPSEQGWTLS